MKRLIVIALERSCGALDVVGVGRCRLSRWSGLLDERWRTGVWLDKAAPGLYEEEEKPR